MLLSQSETLADLTESPTKDALTVRFKGRTIDDIRTPALVIDRSIFAGNCAKMHEKAQAWGADFRAHLKTHKTVEGTRLQLQSASGRTSSVVVSTLMEAWQVVRNGLVADGTVKDILYGVPIAGNKVRDLTNLRNTVEGSEGVLRLLVDHQAQIRFLEQFAEETGDKRRWSVFIKINGGQNRAGVVPKSPGFDTLLQTLIDSPVISIHGFYGHAGNSYGSTSLSEASQFLSGEVNSVNDAAEIALSMLSKSKQDVQVHTVPFVLSVGSTPTAHAASAEARLLVAEALHGTLELHAGNYPMLDLQQRHTSLIDHPQIAQRVRATVISYYPKRGVDGSDEALIDAGAIAFSKDTGPSGGYGEVLGFPWKLTRISQEHGILTQISTPDSGGSVLSVGTVVDIVGQHACLIAAAHPWFYVVDSSVGGGKDIVDIWVPWKGW